MSLQLMTHKYNIYKSNCNAFILSQWGLLIKYKFILFVVQMYKELKLIFFLLNNSNLISLTQPTIKENHFSQNISVYIIQLEICMMHIIKVKTLFKNNFLNCTYLKESYQHYDHTSEKLSTILKNCILSWKLMSFHKSAWRRRLLNQNMVQKSKNLIFNLY